MTLDLQASQSNLTQGIESIEVLCKGNRLHQINFKAFLLIFIEIVMISKT
jgi:hypothetical protein